MSELQAYRVATGDVVFLTVSESHANAAGESIVKLCRAGYENFIGETMEVARFNRETNQTEVVVYSTKRMLDHYANVFGNVERN